MASNNHDILVTRPPVGCEPRACCRTTPTPREPRRAALGSGSLKGQICQKPAFLRKT